MERTVERLSRGEGRERRTAAILRGSSFPSNPHAPLVAVLEEIIRSTSERDGPVYDALVEAMGSIESRHYRGQIAELLLPR
jgi:hypothetical protein